MAYRFVPAYTIAGLDVPPCHECKVSDAARYHMPADWIDTDNHVWDEPYHLYTETDYPRR